MFETASTHPKPEQLRQFLGSRNTTLGEQVLDVAKAEAESLAEPNRVADDLGLYSVTAVTCWQDRNRRSDVWLDAEARVDNQGIGRVYLEGFGGVACGCLPTVPRASVWPPDEPPDYSDTGAFGVARELSRLY